jgi:hypothetical protein
MAEHTRNPLPKHLVWRQDTHRRFYWLAVDELQPGAIVRATLNEQTIDLRSAEVRQIIVRVNDRMLNLDQDIIVTVEGRQIIKHRVNRSIGTMARTLAERGDASSIFSGEIAVTLDGEPQQE